MGNISYKTDQNNSAIIAYREAVEKGKKDQHVLPVKNGGWVVRKLLSDEKSQVFNAQLEAISYAKSIAQNQGTAVFVHGQDGRIKDRIDYSTNSL